MTPAISKIVARYQLGTPYAQFQTLPEKHTRFRFTVTSCITYLIIGTFTLFVAIYAVSSLFDGSDSKSSRLLLGIAGILIFALWMFISGDSKTTLRTWTIYVCPHGLLRYDARTQTTQAVQWEQIKEFYIHTWEDAELVPESGVSRVWKCYKFTLKCTDGTTFKFEGTSAIGALQGIIEKEIVLLQLPPIIETYNEGKTITFGAITLNQTGVSNGQYTFTWDKVLCIDFEGEFICVRGFQWDVSFRVPKLLVPNACVLEAFVNHLDRQGKTEKASPINMTASEKRFSRKVYRLKRHRNT